MKIVLKHLTKQFISRHNKKEIVTAVNDFDFEIPDGKLIGLLGPSGCGKSTTLNLICGLEEPTEGRIYFDDLDVTDLPPENRGVGMVFQNYALYPHLSVRQNIVFPLENLKGEQKLDRESMNQRALEAAKLVQIEELMERKPNELSGGQQQRVAIARALIKTPGVLLLDEPLSNLDARLRLQTREQIRRIQKETGITTIFVTHDQEEAMSISDLIIVMEKGVLQQMGEPQEVYSKPVNLFVAKFLGTPAINVFDGYIKKHKVYIGKEVVGERKVSDQEVYVAIRPEAFVPDTKGKFSCEYDRTETTGRDTSIVTHHEKCISDYDIRAIVSSDAKIVTDKNNLIRFRLKDDKVHVFSKVDEKVI
ncbi:MAG: ABC transporter ATP-binding protein [Erysipelotrichaceae bacterium]|nr:ABC transporter ATP-binding protein [Erysipelotrichaceae bacterium]